MNRIVCCCLLCLSVFCARADKDYQAGLEFLAQPRYSLAYKAFERACETLGKPPFSAEYVSAMIRAGEMDVLFAKTHKAIQRLSLTRDIILKDLPARKDLLADCLDQLGAAYEEMDDVESAVIYYRKAIELKTALYGKQDARTGYSYIKLTKYYSFRQLQDSANYYSRLAFNVCEKDTAHQSMINMGEVYLGYAYEWKNCKRMEVENYDSLYDKVRRFYFFSLDYLHRRFPRPTMEEARIYQGLANSYADFLEKNFEVNPLKGDRYFHSARTYYQKALALKRELLGDFHPQVATTYYTLALLYLSHPGSEFRKKSLEYYQKAMESITDGYQLAGKFDVPPLDHVRFPYYLNVLLTNQVVLLEKIYAAEKDTVYARIIHEHNRYRLRLWDVIIRTFESAETARIIRVWNGVPFENSVESAFRMFRLSGDSSYLFEVYPIIERGRNNEFLELVIRTGKFDLARINEGNYPIVPLKRFREYLRSTESVFLELLPKPLGEPNTNFAMFVTPDSFKVTPLIDYRLADSLIASLQEAMTQGNAKRYSEAGYRLYEELIFKPTGGVGRRLIISVTGSWAGIPFEALPVRQSDTRMVDFRKLDYLMNHTEVNYALSATVLEKQCNTHYSSDGALSAFAPAFVKLSDLPFSGELVEELSGKWGGSYYSGNSATAKAFKEGFEKSSVIHLGTHAESDLEQPERSALYFAGPTDGRLSLGDIYRMSFPVELTVLSACESAQGRMSYGEGLKSFSRAFAQSGSKSTVSTLWKVDDRSTSEVLRVFYRNLGEGKSKGSSLREAKMAYLQNAPSSEAANPFYWSGLVLAGDPSPIFLEKKTQTWKWLAVSGILISLFAIGFYRRRKKVRG